MQEDTSFFVSAIEQRPNGCVFPTPRIFVTDSCEPVVQFLEARTVIACGYFPLNFADGISNEQ